MTTRKVVASALAAVLALSILSLSVPALSQTDGEEEEPEEESEAETEEESEEETGKARGLAKKAAKEIAKQARKDAKEKGKPEVVGNIDKAEKYFGKHSKVIVVMKIGLEYTGESDSKSFGSAHLFLKKFGDEETKFRAVINVIVHEEVEVEYLTACMNGEEIGEGLRIVNSSEEVYVAHLRESTSGVELTIPGTTVEIYAGEECRGDAILSGSI
ncbi:MAG: hypothetical protein ACE5J2_07820 [Nitrososphaerales archaeon]